MATTDQTGQATVSAGVAAGAAGAEVAPAIASAGVLVLTARAVKRITVALLEALRRFAEARSVGAEAFVFSAVRAQYPRFDVARLRELVSKEAEYEQAFRDKQQARVAGDLPSILSIIDPVERQARLQALVEREKRYSLMREEAMLDRALGEVEVVLLGASSPEGAYWKLSPNVKEHTLDCLAMGERFWPWAVLRQFHPPVHYGCPCSLWGLDEAVAEGWMDADQVPDERDAIQRYRQIAEDLDDLEEAGAAEPVAGHELEEARLPKVAAVATGLFAFDGDLAKSTARVAGASDRPPAPIVRGVGPRRTPLRWTKGYLRGGEFRPTRGGSSKRTSKRLFDGWGKTPLERRGEGRGRYAWVAGKYTHVPEAVAWERKVGRHTYTSPADSTNVYRDGKLSSAPTVPAPKTERAAPASPGVTTEPPAKLVDQADEMRAVLRDPGRIRTSMPLTDGEGSSALAGLVDAGFVLDRLTPLPEGRRRMEFRFDRSRLALTYDGEQVSDVTWAEAADVQKRALRARPPRSWGEFVEDALGWADEMGERFGAEVQVPEVRVNPELADHAGTHQWAGEVDVGRDTPRDIDRAGAARATGRELTDSEARGVWSSYWVVAHEAAHGVNPIEPMLFRGADKRLEEALTEEAAHLLATERLEETGQRDVLAWREANPDAIAVRGVYELWREAFGRVLDKAGVEDWQARREMVYDLKFATEPAERWRTLGRTLARHNTSRTVDEWTEWVRQTMRQPKVDADTGDEFARAPLVERRAVSLKPRSPGFEQVRQLGYDRFPEAVISEDGALLTDPSGMRRRVEHVDPSSEVYAAGMSGSVIAHYEPGQELTWGGTYADGTEKSYRFIDTEARAKLILRAWAGKGSPGTLFDDDDKGWLAKAAGKFKGWFANEDDAKGLVPGWEPKKWVSHPAPPPRKIGGARGGPVSGEAIPTYDHVELTVKGKPGPGTREATDANGGKWLVKAHEGDLDHVASEVLANAIYREAGVKVPEAGTVNDPKPDFAAIPDVSIPDDGPVESGGKRVSTGVIVLEGGKLWVYEPRNHYGGYEHTFPKGGVEGGLTQQQNAHKELWEETGLHANLFDVVGDFEGDTTVTRYYVGARAGGVPVEGDETFAVKHVTFDEAREMLNKQRDHDILDELEQMPLPVDEDMEALADDDPFPGLRDEPVVVVPAAAGTVTVGPAGAKGRLGEGFMVDALLGNWGFTNVRWDKDGGPVRVDQDSALMFRADGETKNFGPVPTEVWTLLSAKGKGHGKVDLDEEQRRELAGKLIGKLSHARLDALVDAAPFESGHMREDTRDALHARLRWMEAFAKGDEDIPGPLEGGEARGAWEDAQAKLSLLPPEKKALAGLPEHGAAVNAHLKSGASKGEASREVQDTVKALDGLTRFVKGLDEDSYVYFGANMKPERAALDDLGGLFGKTFEERGFRGAWVDRAAAERHPVVMRALLPAGSRAVALNSLPGVESGFDHDVLLPRGQRFRVVGRSVGEDGRVIVDLVAIPPAKPKPKGPPKKPYGPVEPYPYSKAGKAKAAGKPSDDPDWRPSWAKNDQSGLWGPPPESPGTGVTLSVRGAPPASPGTETDAPRTGFADLDRAIADFMEGSEGLDDYRDPQNAWGACEEVAEEFADFLKQRGFRAYATADELAAFPGYEDAKDSAAIGAGDFSYPEHAMVEVYGLPGLGVNTVTIDFTAAQYGFTEFPKIEPPASPGTGGDTPQQKAILRYNATARKVRKRYPAGTRVEAVAGIGEPGSGRFGTVKRHVPGSDAQGGSLTVEWDNGITGRHSAATLRSVPSPGIVVEPGPPSSPGTGVTPEALNAMKVGDTIIIPESGGVIDRISDEDYGDGRKWAVRAKYDGGLVANTTAQVSELVAQKKLDRPGVVEYEVTAKLPDVEEPLVLRPIVEDAAELRDGLLAGLKEAGATGNAKRVGTFPTALDAQIENAKRPKEGKGSLSAGALGATHPQRHWLKGRVKEQRGLIKRNRRELGLLKKGEQLCERCGGAGGFAGWPGWTCFECGGSGSTPIKKTHIPDPEKYADYLRDEISRAEEMIAAFEASDPTSPQSPGTGERPGWEWSKDEQLARYDMTFSTFGDAVPGGYNGGYTAYSPDGERLGAISYQSETGDPAALIDMVDVEPEHRGEGVAAKLLDWMRRYDPAMGFTHGYTTEDGTAWRESLPPELQGDIPPLLPAPPQSPGTERYSDGLTTVRPGDLGPGITSSAAVAKLAQEIAQDGDMMPIEIARDGSIVDGEHRYRALLDLGAEDIPVFVGTQLGASGRLERAYPGIRVPVNVPPPASPGTDAKLRSYWHDAAADDELARLGDDQVAQFAAGVRDPRPHDLRLERAARRKLGLEPALQAPPNSSEKRALRAAITNGGVIDHRVAADKYFSLSTIKALAARGLMDVTRSGKDWEAWLTDAGRSLVPAPASPGTETGSRQSIPKPPQFITSNAKVKAENEKHANALHALAVAGDVDALKAYDKFSAKSGKLVKYQSALVGALDPSQEPPKAEKPKSGPKAPPPSSGAVKAAEDAVKALGVELAPGPMDDGDWVKVLTKALPVLEDLEDRFPGITAGLKLLRKHPGATALGVYDLMDKTVAMRPSISGTVPPPDPTFGGTKTPSFNIGSDWASVLRHELGHHIDYNSPNPKEWRDMMKVTPLELDGKKTDTPGWATANVSGYSKQNTSEALAEMVCFYTSESYVKGYLPPALEAILEGLVSRKPNPNPPDPATVPAVKNPAQAGGIFG